MIVGGPEAFLVRFGREVVMEMAILDAEPERNLTPHGRDLRDWLHRVADRVAAQPLDRREPEETNNTTQPKGNPHANR